MNDFNDPNLPVGLVLFFLFGIAGVLGIAVTRNHRQTKAFQQRLFAIAFTLRFAMSVLIYQVGLVSVLKDEDGSGWIQGAYLSRQWERKGVGIFDLPLVLTDAFSGHHKGYTYLLGLLFYLTEVPARLPAAALNCFIGALTVVFIYRVARSLFSEKIARQVGWWTTFMPSMIIWASQTVKEPTVIFLEIIALYCCIRLKRDSLAIRHIAVCGLAIIFLIPFRFYAAYIAGASILLTLLLPKIGKGKFKAGSALAVATLVIPLLIASGVLIQQETEFEKYNNLEGIQKFKIDVATGIGGGSGVQSNYDLKTPSGFIISLAIGGAHLLLAPFPWQLGSGSLRLILSFPELLVWWWLFFVGVVPGFYYLVRYRFSEVQALIFFMVGMGLLYSLMFGNVGLVFRQRAQLLPWLLTFAVVGLERRRLKRLVAGGYRNRQIVDQALAGSGVR